MPTPYHRLARETPAYAWWKLPVAGVVIVTAYFLFSTILLLGAAIYFAAAGGEGATMGGWLNDAGDLDLDRLDYFVLDMLGLAVLIPAVLLGVLATGPRPVGYLSSVTGRLRWGWLGRTTVIAVLVFGATFGAMLAVGRVARARRGQRTGAAGPPRRHGHRAGPADRAVPGRGRGVRVPRLPDAAGRLLVALRVRAGRGHDAVVRGRPRLRAVGPDRRRPSSVSPPRC